MGGRKGHPKKMIQSSIKAVIYQAAIMVPLLAAMPALYAQPSATPAPGPEACPEGVMRESYRVGDYLIRQVDREEHPDPKDSERVEYHPCLEIRQGMQVLFSEKDVQKDYIFGNGLYEEDENSPSTDPPIKPGDDLTGLGVPNVLITTWTGGEHCCLAFYIFELGKSVNVLRLDAGDNNLSRLKYDPASHTWFFEDADWNFDFWKTGFADSPAPAIALSARSEADGRHAFHLDWSKMRKPAPTPDEFKQLVNDLRKDEGWKDTAKDHAEHIPPALWGDMLDLIYSDNTESAWKLLDAAWPSKKPGKSTFISEFCEQLTQSTYINDLRPVLKPLPADCNINKKESHP